MNGAIGFACASEQATQYKMQFQRVFIEMQCLAKGIDSFVVLVGNQQVQPFKIGGGQ